jgi:uncharacterized protein YijF (DUF1287 family)
MRRRSLLYALAAVSVESVGAQTLDFGSRAALAAEARTSKPEIYDPSYRRISYPMGDVPDDRGVCTDVVIRAFRAAGVDLQALVHEDMRRAFDRYPKAWGLSRPDPNIDHRRVPNLETFFTRRRLALAQPVDAARVRAGDLVSWRLTGSGLPHIGIVSTQASPAGRPLLVHNIGAGSQLEDILFAWPVVGWFRWPG